MDRNYDAITFISILLKLSKFCLLKQPLNTFKKTFKKVKIIRKVADFR